MSIEDDVSALIDLIYEAAFDSTLWPLALTRLADTMGTAQIGILSLDRRARTFDSIAPRCDPVMDAIFKKYWAFHNPLWPRTIAWPVGEIFSLDSLIPRKDFVATPFFNEWMRPAEFGIASMGANLLVRNDISTMISVANAPGKDEIIGEQTLVFKTVLRHVNHAVRIHRKLQLRDLDHDTAPDRLERLPRGVMLVTSCTRKAYAPNGPGGEISIPRDPRCSPLRVTVTPLRSRGTIAELPWLGLDIPVAIVTVVDAAREKWMH